MTGHDGHGLTHRAHPEVSAINGETVSTGQSPRLRVLSVPMSIKGSSLDKSSG